MNFGLVCTNVNALALSQEYEDKVFERKNFPISWGGIPRLVRSMFNKTTTSKDPIGYVDRLHESKTVFKLLVIKPISAIFMTCLRATLFIGIPIKLIHGALGSYVDRSFTPINEAVTEIAQLTRLFIRGVCRSVPLIGPLLGRAWSVVVASACIATDKIFDRLARSKG